MENEHHTAQGYWMIYYKHCLSKQLLEECLGQWCLHVKVTPSAKLAAWASHLQLLTGQHF